MNFATKNKRTRILVWIIWLIVLLVYSKPTAVGTSNEGQARTLLGVVSHSQQNGSLFPWLPRYHWKQRALCRYRAWRRAYGPAKWAARRAWLAMSGAVTLAQLVNWYSFLTD